MVTLVIIKYKDKIIVCDLKEYSLLYSNKDSEMIYSREIYHKFDLEGIIDKARDIANEFNLDFNEDSVDNVNKLFEEK